MRIESDIRDVEILETKYRSLHLAHYLAGSRAFGLSLPTSDFDYRGIFLLPATEYLRVEPPVEQVSDAKNDRNWYSLRRFCQLAESNLNFSELLFMPDDCRRFESPSILPLLEKRSIFLSQFACDGQIKSAEFAFERSKSRKSSVENDLKNDFEYDGKKTAHSIRRLLSVENVLRFGVPKMRFDGAEREFLLNVRADKFSWNELQQLVEEKISELRTLQATADLPPTADRAQIDDLVIQITENWSKK